MNTNKEQTCFIYLFIFAKYFIDSDTHSCQAAESVDVNTVSAPSVLTLSP